MRTIIQELNVAANFDLIDGYFEFWMTEALFKLQKLDRMAKI